MHILATRDLKAVSHRLGHTSVRMADQNLRQPVDDDTGRSVAQAIDVAPSWPSGSHLILWNGDGALTCGFAGSPNGVRTRVSPSEVLELGLATCGDP